MSGYERNKGILVPINPKRLSEEQREDPEEFDNLMAINGGWYIVLYEARNQADTNICKIAKNEDGTIEFQTMHHNGGASLQEVLEDGLKYM